MSGRLRASWLAALALPVLVWYLGSFFFHGDIGKWLDDYAAHVRDPETGSFEWSKLLRYQWWFFWRPIHVHLVFTLQTLFYNHDWVTHLFGALMHALACFSLWKFLRECALHPGACAIAALLMLGAPQGFEAIHWPATVSTSIATAGFFWAARVAVRNAQHRNRGPATLGLGLLGFLIPCLYEQPAAALAGLPLLYLGASVVSLRSWATIVFVVRRMVIVLVPCALGIMLYLALYYITVRHDGMTRESQFALMEQNWPRIRYLIWDFGVMIDPISGMGELWKRGVAAMRGSSIGLVGWEIVLAAVSGAWVWAMIEVCGRRVTNGGRGVVEPDALDSMPHRTNRTMLVVFALSAIVLAALPILAIRGAAFTPRLMYFPLGCMLVIVGVACDVVISVCGRRERLGAAVLASVAAASALGGSVMLIGVQVAMRQRYETDMTEMRELARMVPQPPKNSIFVAMRALPDPRDPRADRLRGSFQPVWDSPWAVNTLVKHVFHRSDVNVSAIYTFNQSNGIVRLGEPTMIAWNHYYWHLPTPRVENYCPRFSLAQMIPFTINEKGVVALVDRMETGRPDGTSVSFEFPAAKEAAARGALVRQMRVALPIERGNPWLVGWTWRHRGGGEVRFLRLDSWGASDRVVRMHPPTPGVLIDNPDTDEMELPLTQLGAARRMVFYATFDQATIDLSVLGDGVDLVWTLEGCGGGADGGSRLLHTEHLDPAQVKEKRAWNTITLDVPPVDRPCTLRLTVAAGPNGNVNYDRVMVTSGEEVQLSPKQAVTKPESKKE